MAYATKEALLGASDLTEREVELPSVGLTVRVRVLPAAYSIHAQQEAAQTTIHRGEATAKFDILKLQMLQVLHGMVEPKLSSIEEVRVFAEHCGPAFDAVVDAIQDLSGFNEEEAAAAEERFPAGGGSENGASVGSADTAGSGGPDLPARSGAPAGDAGE